MNRKGAKSYRNKGKIGEEVALNFLKQNGYEILEQNYYYNHGEIDIIAKDGAVLVFLEVKSRRSTRFGEPEESVTPKKQELLRRTAEGYVTEKNIPDYPEFNFRSATEHSNLDWLTIAPPVAGMEAGVNHNVIEIHVLNHPAVAHGQNNSPVRI